MRELAERAWFLLCGGLGWLLRSARYSKTGIVPGDGGPEVRKHRVFFAPLLVWMSGPLVWLLDTGVRVLPQRDWEERERLIYGGLYGTSPRVVAGGTVVLPYLAGRTLADVLADSRLTESVRNGAIELAVLALSDFHSRGFTHGDAMAENVMVDLEAGVASWFDFETVHEGNRPAAWCRADDLRALLATCLVRTVPGKVPEILRLTLDAYPDDTVTRLLVPSFSSVLRRPLAFHLGQAGLSLQDYREIARLLRGRLAE